MTHGALWHLECVCELARRRRTVREEIEDRHAGVVEEHLELLGGEGQVILELIPGSRNLICMVGHSGIVGKSRPFVKRELERPDVP